MFVLIALGVAFLIGVEQKRSEFKRVSSFKFASNPAVNVWARELECEHSAQRNTALQVAVGLWILAATPIMFASALLPNLGGEGKGALFGVMGTLILIATGLIIFCQRTGRLKSPKL